MPSTIIKTIVVQAQIFPRLAETQQHFPFLEPLRNNGFSTNLNCVLKMVCKSVGVVDGWLRTKRVIVVHRGEHNCHLGWTFGKWLVWKNHRLGFWFCSNVNKSLRNVVTYMVTDEKISGGKMCRISEGIGSWRDWWEMRSLSLFTMSENIFEQSDASK